MNIENKPISAKSLRQKQHSGSAVTVIKRLYLEAAPTQQGMIRSWMNEQPKSKRVTT